ncbi:MAG: hypothetical protein WA709_09875, partial [Stellaceae bacterium]
SAAAAPTHPKPTRTERASVRTGLSCRTDFFAHYSPGTKRTSSLFPFITYCSGQGFITACAVQRA